MGKQRPSDHSKAQKEIKQLEAHQCLVCGVVEKPAHGHHLIYYSEGGAANTQNMVTLCPKCHIDYHNGKLKIDIYRF